MVSVSGRLVAGLVRNSYCGSFSDTTLLEETVARLAGLIPRERILILTNVEQEVATRELLGDFPKENIVAEPEKRDTAAAVALGTGWVAARDHSATMVVLPADHVIKNVGAFHDTVSLAALAAEEKGALVTIGIKPTRPFLASATSSRANSPVAERW